MALISLTTFNRANTRVGQDTYLPQVGVEPYSSSRTGGMSPWLFRSNQPHHHPPPPDASGHVGGGAAQSGLGQVVLVLLQHDAEACIIFPQSDAFDVGYDAQKWSWKM